MGIEQLVPEAGQPHEVLRIKEDLPVIQIMLALEAYHRAHPEVLVDIEHPRENDPDVRRGAMTEWVGDLGPDSLSGKFRAYADTHPEVEVDIPDDLPGLLQTITGDTVH